MRTKDYGEQLLCLLDRLSESEIIVRPMCRKAFQLAGQVVCELDEAKGRVARLEAAIRRMAEAGGREEFQREFDAAKNVLRDAENSGMGVK